MQDGDRMVNLGVDFVEPSTPLELQDDETVCHNGHVFNAHLQECPWHGTYEPKVIDNE